MKIRAVFVLAFLANGALALVSLAVLPARVAIHFGFNGLPDDWSSLPAAALIYFGSSALLFCVLYLSPRLMFMVSPKWISLPRKDYWLQPARRTRAEAVISALLWRFGTAILLLFFLVEILTIQANLSEPVRLNLEIFFPLLILFGLYLVYWTFAFFRAFRIPGAGEDADQEMEKG